MALEGVHIDMSIRLGDILTFIGFCGVGITAFMNIKTTLRLFGFRLDIVDASIEDLKRDYGDGKLHDHRLNRLEEDNAMVRRQLFDLQRGRGWVNEEVSGMYTHTGKVG